MRIKTKKEVKNQGIMDYRDLIKAEFMKRRAADLRYSLRKFAKDMGMTPMHMSYVLRKLRGISKDKAFRIAHRIGLKRDGRERFKFLVQAKSARSLVLKKMALKGLERPHVDRAQWEFATAQVHRGRLLNSKRTRIAPTKR